MDDEPTLTEDQRMDAVGMEAHSPKAEPEPQPANEEQAPAPLQLLTHVPVREWQPGQRIHQVFVVRRKVRKNKQSGEPYLQLEVGDVTGTVEVMVWDDVERSDFESDVGQLIEAYGSVEVHEKYGTRLKLGKLRKARKGLYVEEQIVPMPARPVEELEDHLQRLVAGVSNPQLSELLGYLFDDGHDPLGDEFYRRFLVAPAARNVHQPYKHGLLEHTVSVAQGVLLMAGTGTFGDVDVDVAVTGALLHDVGKVDVYDHAFSAEMSNVGRLHGEIPLTYFRVRQAIEAVRAHADERRQNELARVEAPAEDEQVPDTGDPQVWDAVLHIVSSHHGLVEHGAAVVPATPEAILVHMVDNLGSRLGSVDRVKAQMKPGEEWSSYDRVLGTNVWMPQGESS